MDVVLFALLLFMLITASSMFEFHMLVVTVVMLNILELIMKIVPNYPTPNPETTHVLGLVEPDPLETVQKDVVSTSFDNLG